MTVVMQVNKTSEGKECNQPLVQATNTNKQLLFRAIDDLEDGGMASYSNALTFAYEAFKQFEGTRKEGDGANCLKTIMLFSDGGTEWPEEVFKIYHADNDTKSVRIFTYAVGPHPIPTAVLKQMARCTGAMYSVITTRSSIRTKIQESCSSILAPAQPQIGFHTDQYTTTYTSAVTEELTVSLSRPVYNYSDYTNTSTLVGVAGIDVPIRTLKNLSPFESIGPNGYAFIINNNGFLTLHPDLQKQLSYLSSPPHIDLLDVEEDTQSTALIRDNMIARKSETVQIMGKIRIDENHHILHNGTQFSFAPIQNTPYSLGLVNLKNSDHMVVRKPETRPRMALNISLTLVAPWPYCKNQLPGTDVEQLMKLQANVKDKKKKCNDELVQGLLWSQSWTKQLVQKWQGDHSRDIFGRAVFTRFGLSRFYPESTKADVARWRDPWHNPALRRGEVNKGVSVMPHPNGAYISAPVTVKKDKSQVMAGVVGVNFTANALRRSFMEHIRDSEWLTQEDYLLLLLDDGGLIVTANREQFYGVTLQGRFIGDLSMPILNNLKDSGVYKMDMMVNKQALCKQREHIESRGGLRSQHIPNIFTAALNLMMEIFSWAEYLRYLIYSGVLALVAPGVDAWTEWGITQIGGLEACTMERAVYYFGDMTALSSSMKCTNSSDKVPFWAHRLPNTNALLVAIEMNPNSPECGVFSELPGIEVQRVTKVEPCAYQNRYRKRPANQTTCNTTIQATHERSNCCELVEKSCENRGFGDHHGGESGVFGVGGRLCHLHGFIQIGLSHVFTVLCAAHSTVYTDQSMRTAAQCGLWWRERGGGRREGREGGELSNGVKGEALGVNTRVGESDPVFIAEGKLDLTLRIRPRHHTQEGKKMCDMGKKMRL
ncbi:Voltage-dependent calcium channel subunit alpha-2/delta-1 [Chionoecetes opilio]|uniref:Voltage-dependent calcium channel subunit alpha-2/delta-1 n=1 Tax=Chionoecetes opilio TaxID=41210 RepID=A0A8J4YDR9_CHIOP|nr:Voltage-dependent calcium channel subunit alpha-2/delta-1 [Chionoecetes opilio]